MTRSRHPRMTLLVLSVLSLLLHSVDAAARTRPPEDPCTTLSNNIANGWAQIGAQIGAAITEMSNIAHAYTNGEVTQADAGTQLQSLWDTNRAALEAKATANAAAINGSGCANAASLLAQNAASKEVQRSNLANALVSAVNIVFPSGGTSAGANAITAGSNSNTVGTVSPDGLKTLP